MKKIIFIIVVLSPFHLGYSQQALPESLVVNSTVGKTETTSDPNLFYDYENWPSSNDLKPNDTTNRVLHALLTAGIGSSTYSPSSSMDLNGDGLIDVLIHYRAGAPNGIGRYRYAIFINKGNFKFELAYKCVYVIDNSDPPAIKIWYGDCAAE